MKKRFSQQGMCGLATLRTKEHINGLLALTLVSQNGSKTHFYLRNAWKTAKMVIAGFREGSC